MFALESLTSPCPPPPRSLKKSGNMWLEAYLHQ